MIPVLTISIVLLFLSYAIIVQRYNEKNKK